MGAGRTLFVQHGACGHGGQYLEFAEAAAARGWRVLLPDLRGHGLSGGRRVHVRDLDEYLSDFESIWRHFALDGLRTAIVAQSLGALIAVQHVAGFSPLLRGSRRGSGPDEAGPQATPLGPPLVRGEEEIRLAKGKEGCAALVLLSPFLGLRLKVSPVVYALGWILSAAWPTVRFRSRIPVAELTSDPALQQRHRGDPLIQRYVTAGWFFALQRGVREALFLAPRVDVPLLVLQGNRDRIVDADATAAWLAATASTDRTLLTRDTNAHELLYNPHGEWATGAILEWLEGRVSGQ